MTGSMASEQQHCIVPGQGTKHVYFVLSITQMLSADTVAMQAGYQMCAVDGVLPTLVQQSPVQ